MRILITNDDGIDSPALPLLVKWATKHFTRDGVKPVITVAAPKVEQSGKSQAIEIRRDIEVKRLDMTVPDTDATFYSVDSTPADCVRFCALTFPEKIDLVISGINRGFNLGHDIAYSGTCGAIFEASRHKLPALAVSSDPSTYLDIIPGLDEAFELLKSNGLLDTPDFLYNINVPYPSNGVRFTHQGDTFYRDWYERVEGDLFRQYAEQVKPDSDDLSVDTCCVQHGYTSVTPLTAEKTNLAVYDKIKAQGL